MTVTWIWTGIWAVCWASALVWAVWQGMQPVPQMPKEESGGEV